MADKPIEQEMRAYGRLDYIRPVVRDGWYNAFTDLAHWKGMYFLCYRQGINHGASNSVEVVLRSNDLRRWRQVKEFESPHGIDGNCAAADGHFCVTPERLYLVIGTRTPLNSYLSYTSDGVHWSEPQLMQAGEAIPYFWRIRWSDGRFYAAVNLLEQEQGPRLDLVVSGDGVDWSFYSKIDSGLPPNAESSQDGYSEESDLFFRSDGELWCVVRTNVAQLYYAQPPYETWEHGHTIPDGCDAPVICQCDEEVYLAGGAAHSWMGTANADGKRPYELQNPFSYHAGPFTHHRTTGLFRLQRDGSELLMLLPAAGDASYAGLVCTEPGKLVLSYYSDVGYASGEVRLKHFPEYVHKASECDIYVAGIDVGEQDRPW